MTATVTKLNPNSIKEASIPDVLQRMETADTTFVIHLTAGRWDLQVVKGQTTIWSLVGILQTMSTHFCNVANGTVALKK